MKTKIESLFLAKMLLSSIDSSNPQTEKVEVSQFYDHIDLHRIGNGSFHSDDSSNSTAVVLLVDRA